MNAELLDLGQNIRRLRRSLKMSQEKLAEKSGLHRTYLSDVERGSRNPSFLTLLAVARGLGVTLSELTRDLETGVSPNQPVINGHWAHGLTGKISKPSGVVRPYLSRE
jgi:transcriptional regulator with XRE-family HTH domain